LQREAGKEVAEQVEHAIRNKIGFLAENPAIGHFRRDLTDEPVKVFPAYSWLIIYRPDTRPLQVVSILHSSRDVASILKRRTN
jgi:antitoxin ParD1/3/4/toxin ParE1/3/4